MSALSPTSPKQSSTDEPYLSLSTIARPYAGSRGAAQLHAATLTRFILRGSKATDGTRVKLKALRCGGRWLVRQSDLDAFFAALNPTAADEQPTPRSHAARNRASERAARELELAGA